MVGRAIAEASGAGGARPRFELLHFRVGVVSAVSGVGVVGVIDHIAAAGAKALSWR